MQAERSANKFALFYIDVCYDDSIMMIIDNHFVVFKAMAILVADDYANAVTMLPNFELDQLISCTHSSPCNRACNRVY